MQNFRKMGALLGAGAVIISLAGCGSKASEDAGAISSGASNLASDAGAGVSNAASNAGAAASNVAAGASNAAANAGATISNGAANAGAAISNGAANAGAAISNGAANVGAAAAGAGAALTKTTAIKNALTGQSTGPLKGAVINVDTLAAKKTVVLRGTVKSAAQKTLAASIAKKGAGDFTVENQLVVGK